jgi:hypothetical protein
MQQQKSVVAVAEAREEQKYSVVFAGPAFSKTTCEVFQA